MVLWYFAIAHTNAKNSAHALCFLFVVLCYRSFHGTNFGTQRVLVFLYPFQHLRKRKLNGMVLWYFAVAHTNAKNSAHALCSMFVVFHYRSFHGTNFGTQRVLVFLYPFQHLRKRKLNGMVLWYFAVAHTNAKNSAHALCSMFVVFHYRSFHGTNFGTQRVLVFLYPFQRLRKRKLNGYKKTSAYIVCTRRSLWSE